MPLITFALIGCKTEDLVSEECPECWDEKMQCVDFKCECPEASIIIWLSLHRFDEPAQDRKYCTIPDKLTFKADLSTFGCIDTFAITFLTEPLEVNATTPILEVTSVKPEVPRHWTALPPALALGNIEETFPEVVITNIYPTMGTNYMSCMTYSTSGEEQGRISNINFYGEFVHKDTISGFLQLEGLTGLYSTLENTRKEIKLVRTIPY